MVKNDCQRHPTLSRIPLGHAQEGKVAEEAWQLTQDSDADERRRMKGYWLSHIGRTPHCGSLQPVLLMSGLCWSDMGLSGMSEGDLGRQSP